MSTCLQSPDPVPPVENCNTEPTTGVHPVLRSVAHAEFVHGIVFVSAHSRHLQHHSANKAPQRLGAFLTQGIPVWLILRRSSTLLSVIRESRAETKQLVVSVRRGGMFTWFAVVCKSSERFVINISIFANHGPQLLGW